MMDLPWFFSHLKGFCNDEIRNKNYWPQIHKTVKNQGKLKGSIVFDALEKAIFILA